MELKQMATLVKKTRDAQKTFFREARKGNESGWRAALEQSKQMERELDNAVDEILNPVNENQGVCFRDFFSVNMLKKMVLT